MIRYDPTAPRVGFGIAALLMSAFTVGLIVVLPLEMEQDDASLIPLAAPHDAAAEPRAAGELSLRCTVPPAINVPLFSAVRLTGPDPQCKEPS